MPILFCRAVFFVLLMLPITATGSSVRQLSMAEVTHNSGFIFSGQVIESHSRWNDAKSAINTLITFRIDQTIKGSHDSDEIILSFLGGQVDQTEHRVAAMRYPKVGEKGVYFVIDKTKQLAHPLMGWSQGHFKETLVDGQARMMTANDRPVGGLSMQAPAFKTGGSLRLSHDIPDGLIFSLSKRGAMSKDDFIKQLVRELQPIPAP